MNHVAADLLALLLFPLLIATGYGLALLLAVLTDVLFDIATYLSASTKERR